MRLRLRIHRNELPTVCALWPVPDTQLKTTIAQLLESVNRNFPLEGQTWGLEDYSISVDGYECLHYHELGAVCKEDDEVVIKPLQFAEVRARTLTGRDQITADGRHLLDGVPFGRPQLKAPVRPDIKIPKRKRSNLIDRSDNNAVLAESNGDAKAWQAYASAVEYDNFMKFAQTFGRMAERGLDYAQARVTAKRARVADADLEPRDRTPSGLRNAVVDASAPLTVHKWEREDSQNDESDEDIELRADDEDGDDYQDGSSDLSTSEDASDNESDSDSDSNYITSTSASVSDNESMSETSWNGCESNAPPTPQNVKTFSESSGDTTDKSDRPTSTALDLRDSRSLKRKRQQEAEQEAQEYEESKRQKIVGIPYQGKIETKQRNARRRDTKKLRYLKNAGVLPQDANIAVLRTWEQASQDQEADCSADEQDERIGEDALKTPDDVAADSIAIAPGGDKDTSTETLGRSQVGGEDALNNMHLNKAEQTTKSQEKKQQLLNAIASGGIDITQPSKTSRARHADVLNGELPEETSAERTRAHQAVNGGDEKDQSDPVVRHSALTTSAAMVPPSVARRSKLDLDASKRLLFGSLGVRVPNTQEEKEALQRKLAKLPRRNLAVSEAAVGESDPPVNGVQLVPNPEAAEAQDPEAWRTKIELSAVECCDEDVILERPPFPFYQRWDPQYRRSKNKKRLGKSYGVEKRQKQGVKDYGETNEYVETYDKYNEDGRSDALKYDDADEEVENAYWEEGALLGRDYEEDGDEDAAAQQLLDETADQKIDDGFPSLPEDVNVLPLVTDEDVHVEDFIVFKELVCSAATAWQPKMLTRTAQLLSRDGDQDWRIQLATRDVAPKQYDGEGNRIYQKFEMQGLSDDEEEAEDARTKLVKWEDLVEPRLLRRGEAAIDRA